MGVTQKSSDFLITDKAHPKTPVVIDTTELHPHAGDPVTVTATTPVLGSHTAVTISDRRTHTHVSSAG